MLIANHILQVGWLAPFCTPAPPFFRLSQTRVFSLSSPVSVSFSPALAFFAKPAGQPPVDPEPPRAVCQLYNPLLPSFGPLPKLAISSSLSLSRSWSTPLKRRPAPPSTARPDGPSKNGSERPLCVPLLFSFLSSCPTSSSHPHIRKPVKSLYPFFTFTSTLHMNVSSSSDFRKCMREMRCASRRTSQALCSPSPTHDPPPQASSPASPNKPIRTLPGDPSVAPPQPKYKRVERKGHAAPPPPPVARAARPVHPRRLAPSPSGRPPRLPPPPRPPTHQKEPARQREDVHKPDAAARQRRPVRVPSPPSRARCALPTDPSIPHSAHLDQYQPLGTDCPPDGSKPCLGGYARIIKEVGRVRESNGQVPVVRPPPPYPSPSPSINLMSRTDLVLWDAVDSCCSMRATSFRFVPLSSRSQRGKYPTRWVNCATPC